jgi:hypothetical protein
LDDRQPARTATQPASPASDDEHEEADEPESRESRQSGAPGASQERPDGTTVRIDAPPDKSLFKGLSKRERRMLRKQLKDERRGAAREQ